MAVFESKIVTSLSEAQAVVLFDSVFQCHFPKLVGVLVLHNDSPAHSGVGVSVTRPSRLAASQ